MNHYKTNKTFGNLLQNRYYIFRRGIYKNYTIKMLKKEYPKDKFFYKTNQDFINEGR